MRRGLQIALSSDWFIDQPKAESTHLFTKDLDFFFFPNYLFLINSDSEYERCETIFTELFK